MKHEVVEAEAPLLGVSFARREGSHIDLWHPASSGNWTDDNRLGGEMAADLLDYMRARSAPMVLGHVVEAMVKKGSFGGVEVGFANAIAEAAMR